MKKANVLSKCYNHMFSFFFMKYVLRLCSKKTEYYLSNIIFRETCFLLEPFVISTINHQVMSSKIALIKLRVRQGSFFPARLTIEANTSIVTTREKELRSETHETNTKNKRRRLGTDPLKAQGSCFQHYVPDVIRLGALINGPRFLLIYDSFSPRPHTRNLTYNLVSDQIRVSRSPLP